jgi:hypothetical protein
VAWLGSSDVEEKPEPFWYDDADPFACISPKLPDLEFALASLELAERPVEICSGGSPCGVRLEPMGVASCNLGRPPSCGVAFEPLGVASCRRGGIGRPAAGCPSLVPLTTGRAFGDGGIERPRAGLRGPRPPGTGARRRGTGDAMLGWGLDVPLVEKPGSISSYLFTGALLRLLCNSSQRS